MKFRSLLLSMLLLLCLCACSSAGAKQPQSSDIKELLCGDWYMDGQLCASFSSGGNSEITFDNTMTHYEVLENGSIQLSDRYGETRLIKPASEKSAALESPELYYLSESCLVYGKHELTKTP